jgi:single-strand DNA-binding protein
MNEVKLKGKIANFQLKETPDNGQFARFNIATQDEYNNTKGELVKVTEWHRVVTTDKDIITRLFHLVDNQGHTADEVGITGRLTHREYEEKDGTKRLITEIVCNGILPENHEAIEQLAQYVSEDDVAEALEQLLAAEEEGEDNDMADNHVTMWEPLTDRYTVSELLRMIGM